MQRREYPETLDMMEGLGPEDADYFAWRPSRGQFDCLACGQPCPNDTHLATRHHYNNVWRWIERQRPQWTEDDIELRFNTRTRNRACTYGWLMRNAPPAVAWAPPPLPLALPAPAPAPAQPQAPAPAAPPASAAPPAPAGAQPQGGAHRGAAPAAKAPPPPPPPPPPQQDEAAEDRRSRELATMRDAVTRHTREMNSAIEAVTRDVDTMRRDLRTDLLEMASAVEKVRGEVATMKHEVRTFFETVDATLQASSAANLDVLQASGEAAKEVVTTREDVETIKSGVEKIKSVIVGSQVDAQTMEAVQGDVQTIKGTVDHVMVESQVNGQVLRTLQEEVATIKCVLESPDAADGAVRHDAADGAVRLGRPLTPQIEQSVTQTVESVQQVQGELRTVTQAVQSVKDDVEAMTKAVDAIRETLRAPSRRSPNGIMRTSSSMSSLQLPAVHPQNR